MTALIQKSERDAIGIVSLEQAIVWAMLTLDGVVKSPQRLRENASYQFGSWVTLTPTRSVKNNSVSTYLTMSCDLPFDYHLSVNDALDLIPYIRSFYQDSPIQWLGETRAQLIAQGKPVTAWEGTIAAEPASVNTVEKFLLWASRQKEIDLYDPYPASIPDFKIDIFPESPKGQIIRISGLIPFNYPYYLQNNSVLFSLLPIGTPSPAGVESLSSISWGNVTNKPTIPVNLNDLEDVDTQTILEGATQGLVYDNENNLWKKGTISSQSNQAIDHVSLTSTNGRDKTYTIWGDAAGTINLGTFTLSDGANGADGVDGSDGSDGADGQGIDHVTLTNTSGTDKIYTIWGDTEESINLGSFTLSDGVDGKSAYEIAVDNGFVGTQQEWLDGLVGPTGPSGGPQGPAGANGADGVDGEDGASAYDIAVANGFSGTESEWLDSLVGPQGPVYSLSNNLSFLDVELIRMYL